MPCNDSMETLLRLDIIYYVRATIPYLFSAGLVVAGSAGLGTGQTGQLPRGLHKKGPTQKHIFFK